MRLRPSSRFGWLALGLALAPCAAAQTPVPRPQAAEFLLLPVGARATALGQAAVADAGSTEAIFWNPAGLAGLARAEFAVHHYEAFFGAGDAVAFALPSSRLGTLAVAAYLVDYGDLEVTAGEGGSTVGRITPRNVALSLTYATDVAAGAAVGLTYKLVQFRVDCAGDCSQVPAVTGTTQAVDVGLRYVVPGLPVTVGAALRHLGFRLQVQNSAQADPLPTRLAFGLIAEVVRRRTPGSLEALDVRVLADVQGAVARGQFEPVALLGVESGVGELVRFRCGYSFLDSEARGPTVGVGLMVGRVALDLARAFFANDDLGEREPFHVSFRAVF